MHLRKKYSHYTMYLFIFLLLSLALQASEKAPLDPYNPKIYPRTVRFCDYDFKVKTSAFSSTGTLGPNQNIFSDADSSVSIDDAGRLVLNLSPVETQWHAAEIISTKPFGYGLYTFRLASRIDMLDPNVMFSAFLYADDTHEIDIEFSGFEGYNSQFIIQPYYEPNHMETFNAVLNGSYTSYTIDYQPGYVRFNAYHGHDTNNADNLMHSWIYKGKDIPTPKDMHLRFNLYLRDMDAPLNNTAQQIIVSDFNFVPYKA